MCIAWQRTTITIAADQKQPAGRYSPGHYERMLVHHSIETDGVGTDSIATWSVLVCCLHCSHSHVKFINCCLCWLLRNDWPTAVEAAAFRSPLFPLPIKRMSIDRSIVASCVIQYLALNRWTTEYFINLNLALNAPDHSSIKCWWWWWSAAMLTSDGLLTGDRVYLP